MVEDKVPHAFLIETNSVEIFFVSIVNFLKQKNLIKNSDYINNMNLIVIEPDGKEIKASEISNLQQAYSTKPSGDKYNIYVIKEADKLNKSAANKILKFLEEPSSFILGIFITSSNQVISTIKSRCQIFKASDLRTENEYNDEAHKIYDSLLSLSLESELSLKREYGKADRAHMIVLTQLIIEKFDEMLNLENVSDKEKIDQAVKVLTVLNNVLRLLKSNVNIELVLDKLFIEARQ